MNTTINAYGPIYEPPSSELQSAETAAFRRGRSRSRVFFGDHPRSTLTR